MSWPERLTSCLRRPGSVRVLDEKKRYFFQDGGKKPVQNLFFPGFFRFFPSKTLGPVVWFDKFDMTHDPGTGSGPAAKSVSGF